VIHSLCDEDDAESNTNLLLWQLKPEFVVLYDSHVKLLRQLEIYHAYYNRKPETVASALVVVSVVGGRANYVEYVASPKTVVSEAH